MRVSEAGVLVPLRAILLLSSLCACLPACLVRPFFGILLWTILAFLDPQAFVWLPVDAFPWALAVAIPTLIGILLFSGGWAHNLGSSKVLWIVTLWVWFTITSLATWHNPLFLHHGQETWLRWQFVSKVLLMTMAAIAVVDSFARLRMLVMVIAGCFGLYILKDLPFIIRTGGAFRLYGPEYSMIADNNDFGLALNMTLPLFFFLAQSESKRWVRRLAAFLFVITIPAIFFTYSRGALVGLVATLGLIFLRMRQRMLLAPVIVLGVVVALLFAPQTWKDRMDLSSPEAMDASALERINSWWFAWNLTSDNPVFGGGFGTFTPELFSRYAPSGNDIHGPHSVYFQILAEHGFVGLSLYLTLVLSCFGVAHRLIKRSRIQGDPRIAQYANMFRFSLVAFLTSGAFLGRAYFDYFFIIVACLIILERVSRQEWAQDAEAPETEDQSSWQVPVTEGGTA